MSVPPTPPLKSSQRLSAPTRGVATVRAVEEFAEPGLFSGPSMRRATRPIVPSDDPRRLVQGAVQQAAAEGTDRPILDRGRPRIGVPSIPRRQDSTRSPPGTRTPVDITWEDGFSYIDHDEASGVPLSLGPLRSSAPRKSAATTPSPLDQRRQRAGSFESGKPRGLSFHDAREFMRSGRGLRPGSWHEAPIKAGTHSGTDAEHGDRRASRSRSQSPHDGRSRSLSPSVQSRAPRDEDRFTEVSLDGSQLRPLASHPPSPDEHPQLLLADGTSQSTVPDNVPPSPERSNDLSMQSTRWQTSIRRHLGATLGEFLGTTSFLFTAFGGVIAAASNSPEPSIAANSLSLIGFNVSRLIYMSLAFGFSYMVNVWIFFHVSEGLFNPAVSHANNQSRRVYTDLPEGDNGAFHHWVSRNRAISAPADCSTDR